MLRAILARLAARFGGDDERDGEEAGEDEENEGSRFIPSRLDASVLSGHGMGTAEAEREISTVQEQAEMLEEHQHEK